MKKTSTYLLLALISAMCFLILARYIFNYTIPPIDESIIHFIHLFKTPALTTFMIQFTRLSNTIPTIIMTVLITSWLLLKRHPKEALFSTLFMTLSMVGFHYLKLVYERPRPIFDPLIHETGFSFPSGHAMMSMSLSLLLITLFYDFSKQKHSFIIPTMILIYALLIGISRIYLGVHYPTDILGGWLIAITNYCLLQSLFSFQPKRMK